MKHERFLIWGGGGHGKVVADIVRAAGHTLVGFADRDAAKLHTIVEPLGGSVVISEADLVSLLSDGGVLSDVEGATAIAFGIGDNVSRITSLRIASNVSISSLVHPSAVISASSVIGRGSVVFPLAVINAAACVGEGVIVNSGAIIEHDCTIGDGAHVAPRSVLTGGVRVGARSIVGAGAVLLPGVSVGCDVVIGAGAVVTKDVPDLATMAGVPAKPL